MSTDVKPDSDTEVETAGPRTGMRKYAIRIAVVVAVSLSFVFGYQEYREVRSEDFKSACRALSDDADWDGLQRESTAWTDWDPYESDAWLFRATAMLRLDDDAAALECIDHIPPGDPRVPAALIEIMNAQFSDFNRPLDGVRTARHVLDIEPRAAAPQQLLINFLALTAQRLKLIDQIEQAISLGSEPPEAYVYIMLADHLYFTNGPSLNERWLLSAPDAEELLVAREVQQTELKALSDKRNTDPLAIRKERRLVIENLRKRFPENLALLRYLMRDSSIGGDVDAIERLLSDVPPAGRGDSVFWRFRGWYHQTLNELEQSADAYLEAAKLFPLDWNVWHELSEVRRLQNRVEESQNMKRRSLFGKELRRELLQLPNAREVTDLQLEMIGIYFRDCGYEKLIQPLEARLVQRGHTAGQKLPERIAPHVPFRWDGTSPAS